MRCFLAAVLLAAMRRIWLLVVLLIAVIALILFLPRAHARDDGQWKNKSLHNWFDKLQSNKGLCCSFADGVKVEDPDWRLDSSQDCQPIMYEGKPEGAQSAYCVKLNGTWFRVPERALVTEPNKFGAAVVWPYQGASGQGIRCFMPGTES